MFARFDENPAMTLQDIKETKCYGRTHARTDNVKTVYLPQTKFAGGIIILSGIPSECQTVRIKLRSEIVSDLILVQTIWKGYQHTEQAGTVNHRK